ncbi:cytochrome P450 2C28-like [Saccostrea cucullata]|uniref:cytochrome P450 2C28-like n=1 Tax=Saccostrea cuccullata TaxID=36930 RepID=UPI002ED42BE7
MFDYWSIILSGVVVFLFIWWRKTTRDSTLPPGPPTVPFIGNLLSVNPDTLLEKFEEYKNKYGDVFSLVTGSKVLVVVSGYDTLRDVFIKHGDVVSERPNIFITTEIGKKKGLSTASGALWKEHRTFTLNALREFGFGKRSLESRIIEEIEVFVEEITSKKGEPFNIHYLINVCVSNIMCSIVFGHRYDHSDKNFLSLLDKINHNLSNENLVFIATIFPFVRYIPGDTCRIKRVLSNVVDVENHLRQIVKDHEKEFDENNPRDFIDIYMKKMKSEKINPNTTFDEEQLLKILGELFVAGTETTSTALRWFSLFMIRHLDVQDKMRKEINDVTGSSRYPNMEDKQNLPYCEAVIHEVLRFGSIAPISVPHGLTCDLPYKDFTIPKDALLIPNLHSVLFDEKIFQEPHVFRPERFLDDKGNLQNTERVLAFSLGRRVCLGEALARMELFLFVTSLIQRFKLLPEDPDHLPPVEGVLGITYAPKDFVLKAVSV